ncbi:hypothetical protein ONZ45_g9250 [Pleurotus djamor]|nr:hypothetical protein ONZ45_g9250 [Pleurotus djamor]
MSSTPSGVSGDSDHGLVQYELPPEIIDRIITDYTNGLEDRRPIRHLLLVSRLFHWIYAPTLYSSLYLTDSDEGVPREHKPCTLLTPHHLSELQIALSSNKDLPKFIQTFSVREDFQRDLTPQDSRWMQSSLPTFLETQRSSRYLSCTQLGRDDIRTIFSPSFSGLPNLHTLECDQDAFRRVRLAEFPVLEHIIVQMSTRLFPVNNEDVFRSVRTLYINCKPHENLFVLLRSLERIEYLFTGLPNAASIEYSPLPALLDIPSKGLKYISLRQIRFYDDSFIVDRLFNAHPNLVIVDVCPTRPDTSETEFAVDRYVRLGQSGEGKGFGVLRKFSVSQPKAFELWWEVGEIRDNVEEARVNGML